MKTNRILYITFGLILLFTSCDDFFDLYPKDQLTPSTFWNTSSDANAAVTASYEWWVNNHQGSKFIFYEDCMSDIGYNYTGAGSSKHVGHG